MQKRTETAATVKQRLNYVDLSLELKPTNPSPEEVGHGIRHESNYRFSVM